jgi:hypothetical protein
MVVAAPLGGGVVALLTASPLSGDATELIFLFFL